MNKDEFLGRIIYLSYRNIWIFFSSAFISPYIKLIADSLSFNIGVLSYVFGYIFSEFIQNTLGRIVKKFLISFSEHSRRPLDKRLYDWFDGWTAFATMFIVVFFLNGVLKLNPPFDFGIYKYLLPATFIVLITSITVALVTKKM